MRNELARLSGIPHCQGEITVKQAKIFHMIPPARESRLKMFNMITFIKHVRIVTVVIIHPLCDK